MPASPIAKELKDDELPKDYESLEKVIIPDSATDSYWGVWFDKEDDPYKHTAWLMWCPLGDDPSVNDSWGHVEDLEESCRNVLTAIEAIYGVSFHDSIWTPMTAVEGKIIIPSE